LNDKYKIKLSKDEKLFLNSISEKINIYEYKDKDEEFISLSEETFKNIKSFLNIERKVSYLSLYLKNKIIIFKIGPKFHF